MSRWAVMAVLVSCTPAPTVITFDAGPMEELGALGAVKLRSELGLVLQNGVPAWGTEFTAEFNALDAQRCTRTIHGPCTFDRCTRLRLADQVTAGRVSFTVNGSRGRSLDPREGSGVYGTSNGFPESWAAGDALVVSAEGGDAGVGPFSVEVAGPGPLVLSAAVMPEVPHDQPLTLKWAPTTSASVGFSLASRRPTPSLRGSRRGGGARTPQRRPQPLSGEQRLDARRSGGPSRGPARRHDRDRSRDSVRNGRRQDRLRSNPGSVTTQPRAGADEPDASPARPFATR